jgi:hypothetical protein
MSHPAKLRRTSMIDKPQRVQPRPFIPPIGLLLNAAFGLNALPSDRIAAPVSMAARQIELRHVRSSFARLARSDGRWRLRFLRLYRVEGVDSGHGRDMQRDDKANAAERNR